MLETAEDSLRTIKELPPLPIAARHILRALGGDEVVIAELVSTVELEPIVTARLLAIANSAFFQTTHPCTSIRDAIVRLGLKETKQLLLPIVLASFFDLRKCPYFSVNEYWKQLLLVAMGVRHVVECAGNKITENILHSAYTAGLLHNIGLLALVHSYPKEMNQLFKQGIDINSNHELVTASLGISPSEAGYILLTSWGVPDEICMVARDAYHTNPGTGHPYPELTVLIRFLISWYAQDFCALETPEELLKIGITTPELMKAATLINRDMPPLIKIANMLNYY